LGRDSLENQEYDAAIQAFSRQLEQNNNDLRSIRELGIAYYKKGELKIASRLLLNYIQKKPYDGRGLLYLASVYERMNDFSKAIYVYKRFSEGISIKDDIDIINVHIQNLYRKKVRAKTRILLKNDSLKVPIASQNRIVVLNFLYAGKNPLLKPINKGITDLMISDMRKLKVFNIVDRIEMQELVSKMDFGEFGYFNNDKCLQIAKLLGASILIKGVYNDIEHKRVTTEVNILKVDSEEIITVEKVEGNFADITYLEKILLYRILKKLGITITKEKWDSVSKLPTKNFLAFVMYSAGLDYENKGFYEKAAQCFEVAVKLDAHFFQAVNGKRRNELNLLLKSNIFEIEEMANRSIEVKEHIYHPQTQEYMGDIADKLNSSFLQGLDSRKPLQDGVQTNFGQSAIITIQIVHQ